MNFKRFYACLEKEHPEGAVPFEVLRKIINEQNALVGAITIRYFETFPGATPGTFVWLEEERTSPYEDSFRNAVIFINSELIGNRPFERLVATKELMHVFDNEAQQNRTQQDFWHFVNEIEAQPLLDSYSDQYKADREALWKAVICLIPRRAREVARSCLDGSDGHYIRIARELNIPEFIARWAMTSSYEVAVSRFLD